MRRWRAFALLDRELISDERNPNVTTDGVRLHHLVRQVAMTVRDAEAQMDLRPKLIEGMASVYPRGVERDLSTWPKARRLDVIALALVDQDVAFADGTESAAV
jgi:hypothetical protein